MFERQGQEEELDEVLKEIIERRSEELQELRPSIVMILIFLKENQIGWNQLVQLYKHGRTEGDLTIAKQTRLDLSTIEKCMFFVEEMVYQQGHLFKH